MGTAPLHISDILKNLSAQCASAGSIKAWCDANGGISPGYVSDVLNGRCAPGKKILAALKIEREAVYKPKRKAKAS